MKSKQKTNGYRKPKVVWALCNGEPVRGAVLGHEPGKFRPDNVKIVIMHGPAKVQLVRDVNASDLYPTEAALRKALVRKAARAVDRARGEMHRAHTFHCGEVARAEKAYEKAQLAFLRVAK